jgi:hypothetical protein
MLELIVICHFFQKSCPAAPNACANWDDTGSTRCATSPTPFVPCPRSGRCPIQEPPRRRVRKQPRFVRVESPDQVSVHWVGDTRAGSLACRASKPRSRRRHKRGAVSKATSDQRLPPGCVQSGAQRPHRILPADAFWPGSKRLSQRSMDSVPGKCDGRSIGRRRRGRNDLHSAPVR